MKVAEQPATRGPGGLTLVRKEHLDVSDLEELARLDAEAFGPAGLRTYDLAVVAEAGAVYVALMDGAQVGGCQLLRMLREPEFLYVLGIYVRPRWRGRGLGARLLELVVDEARRWGAAGLVLTVSPDNSAALGFYLHRGFEVERLVGGFYGPGEDRYVLRRRFTRG